MNMYCLEGTHYEIGVEYGMLLRANRYLLPRLKDSKIKFAKKCETFVAHFAPELLDELQGMADGGRYNPESLQTMALALDARPACTVVAISGEHTEDGKPLFARNYDWYMWYNRIGALIEAHAPGTHSSIGCNDLFAGRHDGINAAGLAIGIAYVNGGRDRAGIMFPLAVRYILDHYETVEDAVAFLQRIPHVRNTNFLLVDKNGTIATVEASPKQVHVRYSETGFGVITNQFQSSEMAKYETEKRRPPDSSQRLYRLKAWFRERNTTVNATGLSHIMSRPYPTGACINTRKGKHKFGTIWSWIAQPGESRIFFADGNPGTVRYQKIDFGSSV